MNIALGGIPAGTKLGKGKGEREKGTGKMGGWGKGGVEMGQEGQWKEGTTLRRGEVGGVGEGWEGRGQGRGIGGKGGREIRTE
ncbi:unnamed protein product [Closterium sp. NIES-54]